MVSAEFSEACCIHQQLYLRLLRVQQLPDRMEAFFPEKVKNDGPHRNRNFLF